MLYGPALKEAVEQEEVAVLATHEPLELEAHTATAVPHSEEPLQFETKGYNRPGGRGQRTRHQS